MVVVVNLGGYYGSRMGYIKLYECSPWQSDNLAKSSNLDSELLGIHFQTLNISWYFLNHPEVGLSLSNKVG